MIHNDKIDNNTYDELVEALLREGGREQEADEKQKEKSRGGAELLAEAWSRHGRHCSGWLWWFLAVVAKYEAGREYI